MEGIYRKDLKGFVFIKKSSLFILLQRFRDLLSSIIDMKTFLLIQKHSWDIGSPDG